MTSFAEVLPELSYATLDRLRLELVAEQKRRGAWAGAEDAYQAEVVRLTGERDECQAENERLARERDAAREGERWAREDAREERRLRNAMAERWAGVEREREKLRDVVRACREEADREIGLSEDRSEGFCDEDTRGLFGALSRILAACRASGVGS